MFACVFIFRERVLCVVHFGCGNNDYNYTKYFFQFSQLCCMFGRVSYEFRIGMSFVELLENGVNACQKPISLTHLPFISEMNQTKR